MKKSRRGFVVALAIMLAAVAVPAFAAEPMTISGVWEASAGNETYYFYFSPGAASGKMVGVVTLSGVQTQIIPVHSTWEFVEKDGKQLFCTHQTQALVNGNWVGMGALLAQREYRFTTEGGTQKLIHDVSGENPNTLTKIGTKLTDLPEVGPLGYKDSTGGRFWAQEGIVVK